MVTARTSRLVLIASMTEEITHRKDYDLVHIGAYHTYISQIGLERKGIRNVMSVMETSVDIEQSMRNPM